MEEYLGIIKMFAGTYAPVNYLFCHGQILRAADYPSLYAILGTNYGGDGHSTFQLPDLRSKMPIGAGQSPNLSLYPLGLTGGRETTKLDVDHLPSHNHEAVFVPDKNGQSQPIETTVKVNAGNAGTPTNNPDGAYWGQPGNIGINPVKPYTNAKNVTMASDAVEVTVTGGGITGGSVVVGNTGGGLGFSCMPPFIGINFIICVNGIFPPRS